MPNKIDDLLGALTVGGRINPEASHAQPSRAYRDPAETAKFEAETYGTKQIEALMRDDLENWVRWGIRRDWMPPGFRCPLGFLYKSPDVFGGLPYRAPPCDEIEAVRMERIVCSLPDKTRQAFVMYRLDRAHVAGHVVIVKGRRRKAEILGVGVGHYHYLVRQAHRLVYSEWRKK